MSNGLKWSQYGSSQEQEWKRVNANNPPGCLRDPAHGKNRGPPLPETICMDCHRVTVVTAGTDGPSITFTDPHV